MKKYANWLTAAVVALMLIGALTFEFSSDNDFKDILLRLSELPKNIFSFVWEREEVPEEPTEETISTQPTQQKEETPFISFDDLETMPEGENIPLQTIPGSGINELPMDVLKGSTE